MKKYENLDNFRTRTHTVEVVIQSGEHKGKLRKRIGGNCFGLSILESIDDYCIYDIDEFEQIGCTISCIGKDDEGNEWFSYELKNDEGETCTGEDECKYFKNMIVGINIVDCIIDK